MVAYTHTCIFQSTAEGLTCAAPTYFTGRQFLPTYPFVVWVCVHKTKRWINLSKQCNSASAAIIQTGCTTASPKGSHRHVLLAMWSKELPCVVFVSCTGCIQGCEKQESIHKMKETERSRPRVHRAYSLQNQTGGSLLLVKVIFTKNTGSISGFSTKPEQNPTDFCHI